ncbi:AlwI family type II restriction endonuclease [Macrococcus capreoli]|uniref:AlwI family type II restriction endonuclease n=1 Tax=Macrococcus capreoli TaxID=2982690 RepID=UPI003F430D78
MKKNSVRKPLSFSTTIRNPERIVFFVESIKEFNGQILTNELIKKVVKKWIKLRMIRPDSVLKENSELKSIYYDTSKIFDENQLEFIYNRQTELTKGHKEAGFDKGWPSRFDTYMRLPKEFGFIYYKIGEPIEISETGFLLCNTLEEQDLNMTFKESDIFLNALVKYQTANPFRRNLNDNAPFVLFLNTVKYLSEMKEWNKTGIYRNEIPLVICWPDNDARGLAEYISNFRTKYGKNVSNETVYEKCLELLESDNKKLFKLSRITKESVDDFIRKLRITGIISLRGSGRLIDINSFEKNKVDYICKSYTTYTKFDSEYMFYKYMGEIDNNLLTSQTTISESKIVNIREKALNNWSTSMSTEDIRKELKSLTSKNGSNHPILKYINGPTRFEFLMSIALKHQFPKLIIKPNYPIDDEGMPTFTARGGKGDIEVYSDEKNVLVEVTLMRDKSQSTNEIPGITRHVKEYKNEFGKDAYSLFVAPSIHIDTHYMIDFSKVRDSVEIYPMTIEKFADCWYQAKSLHNFVYEEREVYET